MLLVEASSETGLFRHLSDYVSEIPNFENEKLSGSSFFSKFIKFNLDFKNAAKSQKNVTFSEIIASELVSLNCLY